MLDEQAAMYLLDEGYVEDVRSSNLKLSIGFSSVALTLFCQLYPYFAGWSFADSVPFIKGCVGLFVLMQLSLAAISWGVEKDHILATKRRDEQQQQQQQQTVEKAEKEKSNKKPSTSGAQHNHSNVEGDAAGVSTFNLPPDALLLSSNMPRYDTTYTLTLSTYPSSSIFHQLLDSVRGLLRSLSFGVISQPTDNDDDADEESRVRIVRKLSATDYFDSNGVFIMERYQAALREMLMEYAEMRSQQLEGSGHSHSQAQSTAAKQAGSKKQKNKKKHQ